MLHHIQLGEAITATGTKCASLDGNSWWASDNKRIATVPTSIARVLLELKSPQFAKQKTRRKWK